MADMGHSQTRMASAGRRRRWAAVAGLAFFAAQPSATAPLQPIDSHIAFRTQDDRDRRFAHMEHFYTGHRVAAGGRVRPLPAGAPLPIDEAIVSHFMAVSHAAALIVVQDGRIRLERYAPGRGPHDRWTSFSVAKSVTSTLVGAAIRQGAIRSLNDPVTAYLPTLEGTAYDGVTVADLLSMKSGVAWNEEYADPQSDVVQLYASEAPKGESRTLNYLRRLPRAAAPGTRWHYNTGETDLVGELVAAATHRTLSDFLSRAIWRPYGMADPAYWLTDGQGREAGGSGLSMTIRDMARLGELALEGGAAIVPPGWFAEATRARTSLDDKGDGYGLLWWTYPGDRFAARGIFGQSLWVDRPHRLVVAISADWPHATDPALSAARTAFEQAVADAATR